ncbi:MAG TPA: hypothetical protein VL096_19550 [Pirellulaceae bacterium]|nr:hypothetical protein [Pirellulaceae bacterium]
MPATSTLARATRRPSTAERMVADQAAKIRQGWSREERERRQLLSQLKLEQLITRALGTVDHC